MNAILSTREQATEFHDYFLDLLMTKHKDSKATIIEKASKYGVRLPDEITANQTPTRNGNKNLLARN